MEKVRISTEKKLLQLWESPGIDILETTGEKYVIMSDLHMGDGGEADDFRENSGTLERALTHYRDNGFRLILLGDIEEFWQFSIEQIKKHYGESVYSLLKSFGKDRLYRIYGNHDLDWSTKESLEEDDATISKPVEAIKMTVKGSEPSIFLVHGHQGSFVGDTNSWMSRIYIKYIWKPLELIFGSRNISGHPSAARSQVMKHFENVLYSWAKTEKIILICGHTHRAIFASKSYIERLNEEIRVLKSELKAPFLSKERVFKIRKRIESLVTIIKEEKKKGRKIEPAEKGRSPLPCYFNCGCALYTNGITALEIENGIIRLVKWHNTPVNGQSFEVYHDGNGSIIEDFIEMIRM